MNRFALRIALGCAVGALVATAAVATVPDPSQTTTTNTMAGSGVKGDVIALEGKLSPASQRADSCETLNPRCGKFVVQLKDFAGNAIANYPVFIDFCTCISGNAPADLRLSSNQALDGSFGQALVGNSIVTNTTDALGFAVFQVQGSANSLTLPSGITQPGGAAGSSNLSGSGGTPCAVLWAGTPGGGGNVLLRNLRVASFDSDGALNAAGPGAVQGGDASKYAKEIANCLALSTNCRERTDVNLDSFITGSDGAKEAAMVTDALNGIGSANIAGPYKAGTCP